MRTRIKICGLTREADVDAAVEAGADAIGFVLYPHSPRAVSIERAVALARRLPPFVAPVGLFVNADRRMVVAACDALPQLLLQFHGDENAADCHVMGRGYLRAVRMAPGVALLDFAARFPDAQGLLLDAHADGYGGSGKVFDWSLVSSAAQAAVTAGAIPRLVLSGGLNAANVGGGMAALRPWAVDVSSGVEHVSGDGSLGTKGIKDAQAMRRFCQAVREADDRLAAVAT